MSLEHINFRLTGDWDACAARGKAGPGGYAPFILMPNPVLRALGRHRRLRRRAVRHENLSLTARQSRDLLLISGRVDVANTPSGLRPFCPLASPRSTPKERFQFPSGTEGNAAIAAGASFPRCAHSGDLPPRRVNARVRFRFGWFPFQPNTTVFYALNKCFAPCACPWLSKSIKIITIADR
ncbi:hypothetical protein SDC9_02728 [bioreactor metagenome]|uniref:Uncharacterized protein n=1 Tax=bioreactor metagenome TaxID=1076179 RepID=A0A644SRF4_9ZZZZ